MRSVHHTRILECLGPGVLEPWSAWGVASLGDGVLESGSPGFLEAALGKSGMLM